MNVRNLFCVFILLIFISCGNNNEKENDKKNPKDTITIKLDDLNKKIEESPNNIDLYFERAKLYVSMQDAGKALEDMRKVLTVDTNKAAYFYTLSDIYFMIGQAKASKSALKKCISLDPKNTDAILKLAELHFYFKEYPEAIECTSKALKVNKFLAKAYFIKGMIYKENGDTATSVKCFQIATEMDPKYFKAYEELGLLFFKKKNKLALDYFENALKINPKSIDIYYDVAMFYQETKNYKKALETYFSLLQLNPKYKYAYYNIGYINLLIYKDYIEAIKQFTKAIQTDSAYAEAYYMRGLSYEESGDKKNAYMNYQKANILKTNFEEAIEGINRIEGHRKKSSK
ncbi:MAG: tetratricopeptide repeat protein [Bacteroidales bacterium]|nr:tetratricopeptide repeat protein [Bacteroidales bacterium]